jgi:hypothetical protein
MLDPRTLLSAAMVSKKWLDLCRSDSTLRKRILKQIRLEKKEYLHPFVVRIQRKHTNNYSPLSTMNGSHRMTITPVSSKSSTLFSLIKIDAMFSTTLHNCMIIMFRKYIFMIFSNTS